MDISVLTSYTLIYIMIYCMDYFFYENIHLINIARCVVVSACKQSSPSIGGTFL